MPQTIFQVAREKFGFDRLRPAQRAAIESVLAGRDTLTVMPTGAGKSAIYQIAAHLLRGPALIISPLLALQKDQVEALGNVPVGEAALLNSHLSAAERERALRRFAGGGIDFLFLAPEQLRDEQKLSHLRAARPALIVVDEAHCISEWGHDFRPDYARLGDAIEQLGRPTILALTATAAPPVRQEISEKLHMKTPRVIVAGFDRPNIHLNVRRFESVASKDVALIETVREAVHCKDEPGIVYSATRRHAEELHSALRAAAVPAALYHGGLKKEERAAAQEAFMSDAVPVIVATSAFGLGVDKSNVRWVFHADISDSPDAYYQEIGRAGRDGEASRAVLFFAPGDFGVRRFLGGVTQLEANEVALVIEAMMRLREAPSEGELAGLLNLPAAKVYAALHRLTEMGLIVENGGGTLKIKAHPPAGAAALAAQMQEKHRSFARSRLEMLQGYVELHACRREFLLNYFGEEYTPPCRACDNCELPQATQNGVFSNNTARDMPCLPFPIGARVRHNEWGDGAILRYEDDKMTVLFDDTGYKTLAVAIVQGNHLLEAL